MARPFASCAKAGEVQPSHPRPPYESASIAQRKQVEKLRYIHENPVKRGLVERPEDWRWSSFRHYSTGEESVVEIESHWTAQKRERMGIYPTIRRRGSA